MSAPSESIVIAELAESPFAGVAAPASDRFAFSRSLHVSILALSLAVLVLAALLDTSGERQVTLPFTNLPVPELCYSRRMFGLDCPGCGLTRCFVSMAHLRFERAWHFSPAGMLFFSIVAFQVPYRTMQLWRLRRQLPEWEIAGFPYALLGMCMLLLAQWVWRTMF